jgi:uncharacterized membrane protein YuzA (DUF378 family)
MEEKNATHVPATHPVDDTIRFRAILLGFVLTVVICAITPFNNAYLKATPLGGGHFPLAPFFILMVMIGLLTLLSALFNRNKLFTGKELLLTWILMVIGSGIAYTGLARTFFVNLTVPFHFASMENRWDQVLTPLLPSSWFPQNRDAIETLYDGIPGCRDLGWHEIIPQVPWDVWAVPLLIWGTFIILCYFVMMCLINVFSRQWIHNERINFPLLRVPQLLTDAFDRNGMGNMLTDKFLVAGIMVPVLLHCLNGLHFYFPSAPQISTLILAGPYFPEYGLFSGFHKLKIYIYPAFIGFAFLTSKQISLSFWLFFILGGLLIGLLGVFGYNIPAASLGITFGPTLARPEETQMIGAYGIYFLFLVWLARKHLLQVFRQSVGLESIPPIHTEWFDPRVSAWGFVLGMLAIMVWCSYFGMPFLVAAFLVGVFFMVMIVASRIICQGGLAYFTLTVAPTDGMIAFLGPQFFTTAGIVLAGVIQKVLFVDLRESLMPSLLHASQVNHTMKNKKRILAGIVITLTAGIAVSFAAMLLLCYKYGIRELELDWATRTTVAVYENIYNLVEAPVKSGNWVLIFSFVGAVVMLTMVVCYHRFYWWPIHPLGYLTAYSSSMRILWASFFMGWLCNTLCMRYGGVILFKKFRFFFIGLIIGDFLMGGIFAIIGLFGDSSYQVLPN